MSDQTRARWSEPPARTGPILGMDEDLEAAAERLERIFAWGCYIAAIATLGAGAWVWHEPVLAALAALS